MKYYNATAEEAQAIHEGRQTLLIVPMEPQPYANEETAALGIVSPSLWPFIGAPFQPGDTVGIREPWAWGWCEFGSWHSCRVSVYSDYLEPEFRDQLNSAETMPDEAIRTRVKVEKVEAKRLHDLTCDENEKRYPYMEGLGVPGEEESLAHEWNEKHPDHPYDSNPVCWVGEVEQYYAS